MIIDDINKLFAALESAEPLLSFVDPKNELDYAQTEALARMYSDTAFRTFLINNYNSAVKAVALRSSTEVDIAFGKARALTYKEILVHAKRAYTNYEKLKKLKPSPPSTSPPPATSKKP